MKGACRTFRFEFKDDSLIISSADPQIGVLKITPLNGGMPKTEEEAFKMAEGRMGMSVDELNDLEQGILERPKKLYLCISEREKPSASRDLTPSQADTNTRISPGAFWPPRCLLEGKQKPRQT